MEKSVRPFTLPFYSFSFETAKDTAGYRALYRNYIVGGGTKQVILGITLNDGEIKGAVGSIDPEKIHIVDVGSHVFQKL